MKDWPTVVKQANEYQQILLGNHSSVAFNPSCDPTQYLFNLIIDLTKQGKGTKCLTNFIVAAMHLSVHLKVSLFVIDSRLTK
jgi:hypothetical protein